MIPLGAFLVAACLALPAGSDQITAGDLAPAFPGMASVDAATPLALAPVPGVARVFHMAELGRLAARFHVAPPANEICVNRPASPPDPQKMLEAMQGELPDAGITILDWSRRPIPEGAIQFPVSQLHTGPAGSVWAGSVRYGANHRFPIWARVKVQVSVQRVVARRELPPGLLLTAGMLEATVRPVSPGTGDFARSIDQVIGKSPRALIRTGAEIRFSQLRNPQDVVRGDTVRVEVRSGGAHLEFEGRAEASGAAGEMIPVRNLTSQRRFRALIDGKDRVSVSGAAPEKNQP